MADDDDWGDEIGEQVQTLSLDDGDEGLGDDREELLEELKANPDDAELNFKVGKSFQGNDEHDEAKQYFQKAADKKHPPSLFELGRYASEEAKGADEAIRLFDEVLKLDASHARAKRLSAKLLEAKGDYERAAGHYSSILAGDESDYAARASLIQCLDAQGKDSEAEDERKSFHTAFQGGKLTSSYSEVGRFCCTKFSAGDKFVMGFDFSKPGKDGEVLSFSVYAKDDVHEDKVIERYIVTKTDDGKFQLKSDKGADAVATFDASPSIAAARTKLAEKLA